jgi:hypothetical protein
LWSIGFSARNPRKFARRTKTRANDFRHSFIFNGIFMRIQIKQLSWPKGNYMIMIAQGILNAGGLEQILSKVAAATLGNADCKVLIDLIEATCRIAPAEIDQLLSELRPDLYRIRNKVALVSPLDEDHHANLSNVSTCLEKYGFRIAVFRDSKAAVDWLAVLS